MSECYRFLHLEDNELDSELLLSQMEQEGINCKIDRVSFKKEYLEAISKTNYDLIISDNTLPDFTGIDALKFARNKQPNTPFIFVSGTLDEDVAIEAMKWGASDYVLKDKLTKLGLTVKRVLLEYLQKKELDTANERIRESEEKYRTLVETSPESIFLTDLAGIILFANRKASDLYGFASPDELNGNNLIDFFTDEYKEYARENRVKTLSGSSVRNAEYVILNNNNQKIPVEINTSLIKDNNDDAKSVMVIVRDISERKIAEIEVLAAKEKAEEMNKLKSFFLSNMSHELRTPMIAIMGYSEILQEEITNPNHVNLISGILEGASRLNETFNSILELSRIESAILNVQPSACSLLEEVEKTIVSLKSTAERKNLYLNVELKDKNVTVEIDPPLFRKALYHVISNGIKFTKTGGVTIQVDKQMIGDHTRAVVRVIDTGVGIPDYDIQKIFGEFRQGSEGLARGYEGMGIGLSLAKKIIQMMKGEILVDSTPGNGSVFTISLPVKLSDSQVENQIAEKRKSTVIRDMPGPGNKKPAVLLVEDNMLNRAVTVLMLKPHFDMMTASDGITALAIASKKQFDIVLMDINLGEGIDGIETLQRLRMLDDYKDVPVIAVTAYVLSKDEEKFMEMGFDGYVPKPFTKEFIVSTMNKFIHKTKI